MLGTCDHTPLLGDTFHNGFRCDVVFFIELSLKLSSVLEGVLLTGLQAILVAVGLFVVMSKMLSKEAYEVLRPSRIFAVGLIVTAVFYGYVCVVYIPATLMQLFSR